MRFQVTLLMGFVLAVAPALRAQETAKPGTEEVRARWQKMSPDERRLVQENYARWKRLSDEQKALMRERHARLDDARRATRDLLDDDERRKIERLPDGARRRELTRRALKTLKDRYDRLPPDLRRDVERELRDAPPREREERVRKFLQREIPRRIEQSLSRRVDRGELPRDEVDALVKRGRGASKLERMRLLREFVVTHPDQFRIDPDLRKRLRDHAPGEADLKLELRLLEQMDRRRRRPSEAPPRTERARRDRAETPKPERDHRPH